jgi:hypothetical protein
VPITRGTHQADRRRRARRGIAAALVAAGLASLAGVGVDVGRASASGTFCGPVPTTVEHYQAVSDRRSPTWGSGDLTSITDLGDGRRLFLFGDTGYFSLDGDGGRRPLAGFGNNSAWIQDGGCFTQLDRSPGAGHSWLAPPELDGTGYWPGGAAVAGNRLHVFLTRVRLDNVWGTPLDALVATFEMPSLRLARLARIPFDGNRIFGSGAVYDGGYVYTYASQRRPCALCFAGDVYLARVKEHLVSVPSAWQYRAAGGWTSDPRAAVPVLRDAASNTHVTPWRNGFLLVSKTLNIVGPDVDAYWAPAPEGPWSHLGTIYSVPHPPPSRRAGYSYADAYSYMATAIPMTIAGGNALLAYNVASFDPNDGILDGLMGGPRFVAVTIPLPPVASPRPRPALSISPWEPIIAADRLGRVHAAGGAAGVASRASYTTRAVGVARTVTGQGTWTVAEDGGVFTTGDAQFHGSTGGMRLNEPVVGIAPTPTGRGYWLVASDGGVFSFGDARFHGSTGGMRLNRPVLGMAPTPTGRGYWLVASDGGVFSFGDARFHGSTGGMRLSWPVTDIAPTPSGRGYHLVTLDGAVYAFGDAQYRGGVPYPQRAAAVGLAVVPGGYRIVDAAGVVHHFGASSGPRSLGSDPAVGLVGVAG